MAFNWRKFPWTNLHDLNLDWIIQTVKTLEENLADAVSTFREMIDTAISNTLTGSGDLTINKTGDVNITGNKVVMTGSGGPAQIIGGAFISDSSEQLTLHNPNSSSAMTANYNSGVLTLTNNQQLANGVAVYPINTPADGGGDNSTFAANVGYVKDAVNTVDSKIDTEIDRVKTLLDAERIERQANDTTIRQNTIFNITANISDEFTGGEITLDSTVISQLKAALSSNRLVSLTLQNNTVASGIYETYYFLLDSYISAPEAHGEYTVYFYNVGKTLAATINDTATGVLTYSKV